MNRIVVPSFVSLAILFGATAEARAAVPAPAVATTPAPDDGRAAERARVVAKGKRLGWIGLGFSGAGFLLTISTSITKPGGYNGVIIGASTGLALCITGVALTAAGFRRVRRPEKFMRKTQVAAAPWGDRNGGGASLTVRF
ncbi:MAG TPA: hypothetical protein VG755_07115 [Nannocystaceae bacterium]|nr:hypothetical protein [Nannocystaceae bacterium]